MFYKETLLFHNPNLPRTIFKDKTVFIMFVYLLIIIIEELFFMLRYIDRCSISNIHMINVFFMCVLHVSHNSFQSGFFIN